MLDGYVSPLECCYIREAESLYRNAHQYFYSVSRDLDAQRRISKEIGDKITYTDNEMYGAVAELCRTVYSVSTPSVLPKEAKVEVARILRIDIGLIHPLLART